jgi:hypothetical protein
MIILTETTDTLTVIVVGSKNPTAVKCYASYRDTTSSTITPDRNATSSNGATPVLLVRAPGSSTQRIVDYISIHNTDSESKTVSVQFDVNGTPHNLFVGIIKPNEKIEYQESEGFRVLSSTGAIRITDGNGAATRSSTVNFVLKSTDQTSSADAFADVTGLSFPVSAGKTYWFRFVIPYTTSNTSTGIRFAVSGPSGTPPVLYYYMDVTSTTLARFIQRGITTYDGTSNSATSASATANIGILEGVITAPADGNVILRFSREVGVITSVTQKAGAFVKYLQI